MSPVRKMRAITEAKTASRFPYRLKSVPSSQKQWKRWNGNIKGLTTATYASVLKLRPRFAPRRAGALVDLPDRLAPRTEPTRPELIRTSSSLGSCLLIRAKRAPVGYLIPICDCVRCAATHKKILPSEKISVSELNNTSVYRICA